MLTLPEELPDWYTVEQDKEKGWTPKTEDIVIGNHGSVKKEVIQAWKNDLKLKNSLKYTIKIDQLQIISPIQVGGENIAEGGILPAQIGGLPYIPGSTIRGALLKWIKTKTKISDFTSDESDFWKSLISEDSSGWRPRKIRFESVFLNDLLNPFPLHAQQNWQIFNQRSNQLSIQWQASPKHPPSPGSTKLCIQILLSDCLGNIEKKQEQWLRTRLEEMLQHQGIGRGTSSGFGRMAKSIPSGSWTIELTGMKPCIQQKNNREGHRGKYRWSPQVLRASLRGYFTRLSLSLLAKDHALDLTNKIFGGLNSPAHLILTSYLRQISGGEKANEYNNFETKDAHSTWIINIDCNQEFKPLVNALLNLASRLGGIGPGWRRPPHELTRTHCFRGSEFILSFNSQESLEEESLQQLIDRLQNIILNLAQEYSIPKLNTPSNEQGRIISIWRGKKDLWEEIVHRICRSDDPNRPDWCGSSTNHPSGYAIRQYEDHCLVTVFESPIESELERLRFKQDWCEKTSQNPLISIS